MEPAWKPAGGLPENNPASSCLLLPPLASSCVSWQSAVEFRHHRNRPPSNEVGRSPLPASNHFGWQCTETGTSSPTRIDRSPPLPEMDTGVGLFHYEVDIHQLDRLVSSPDRASFADGSALPPMSRQHSLAGLFLAEAGKKTSNDLTPPLNGVRSKSTKPASSAMRLVYKINSIRLLPQWSRISSNKKLRGLAPPPMESDCNPIHQTGLFPYEAGKQKSIRSGSSPDGVGYRIPRAGSPSNGVGLQKKYLAVWLLPRWSQIAI